MNCQTCVCVCVCGVGVFVVINCWLCVSAETICTEGFLVFVLSKGATSNGYKYVSGMRLLLNCGLVQIQLQIIIWIFLFYVQSVCMQ